jgi:hypothetical protein
VIGHSLIPAPLHSLVITHKISVIRGLSESLEKIITLQVHFGFTENDPKTFNVLFGIIGAKKPEEKVAYLQYVLRRSFCAKDYIHYTQQFQIAVEDHVNQINNFHLGYVNSANC